MRRLLLIGLICLFPYPLVAQESSMLFFGGYTSTSDTFFSTVGTTSGTRSEEQQRQYTPQAFSACYLTAMCSGAINSGASVTFTLRKDATNTAETCTIIGDGSTRFCRDANPAHCTDYTDTQYISIQQTKAGASSIGATYCFVSLGIFATGTSTTETSPMVLFGGYAASNPADGNFCGIGENSGDCSLSSLAHTMLLPNAGEFENLAVSVEGPFLTGSTKTFQVVNRTASADTDLAVTFTSGACSTEANCSKIDNTCSASCTFSAGNEFQLRYNRSAGDVNVRKKSIIGLSGIGQPVIVRGTTWNGGGVRYNAPPVNGWKTNPDEAAVPMARDSRAKNFYGRLTQAVGVDVTCKVCTQASYGTPVCTGSRPQFTITAGNTTANDTSTVLDTFAGTSFTIQCSDPGNATENLMAAFEIEPVSLDAPTPSPTRSLTPSVTNTPATSPTDTNTPVNTSTPTLTRTPTQTNTVAMSSTPTVTPTATNTTVATGTFTRTSTWTPSPTFQTQTATPTPTPTQTGDPRNAMLFFSGVGGKGYFMHSAGSAVEEDEQFVLSSPGRLHRMAVRCSDVIPVGDMETFTLRMGAANTMLSCAIVGGERGCMDIDSSHAVDVGANTLISLLNTHVGSAVTTGPICNTAIWVTEIGSDTSPHNPILSWGGSGSTIPIQGNFCVPKFGNTCNSSLIADTWIMPNGGLVSGSSIVHSASLVTTGFGTEHKYIVLNRSVGLGTDTDLMPMIQDEGQRVNTDDSCTTSCGVVQGQEWQVRFNYTFGGDSAVNRNHTVELAGMGQPIVARSMMWTEDEVRYINSHRNWTTDFDEVTYTMPVTASIRNLHVAAVAVVHAPVTIKVCQNTETLTTNPGCSNLLTCTIEAESSSCTDLDSIVNYTTGDTFTFSATSPAREDVSMAIAVEIVSVSGEEPTVTPTPTPTPKPSYLCFLPPIGTTGPLCVIKKEPEEVMRIGCVYSNRMNRGELIEALVVQEQKVDGPAGCPTPPITTDPHFFQQHGVVILSEMTIPDPDQSCDYGLQLKATMNSGRKLTCKIRVNVEEENF